MNIKPCPFCGDSTNIFTSSRGKVGSTLKYNKVCKNCNSEGPVAYLRSDGTNFYLKSEKYKIPHPATNKFIEDTATDEWNKRATSISYSQLFGGQGKVATCPFCGSDEVSDWFQLQKDNITDVVRWACNKCNSYGPTFEAIQTGVWKSIGRSQEQLYDTPFGRILWRDVVMKAAEKWNNNR